MKAISRVSGRAFFTSAAGLYGSNFSRTACLSTDQLGFVQRYEYAAGRVWKRRDTDNDLIVQYTHDSVGRLSRKDSGNNTFTTDACDAAGRALSLANRAPLSLGGGVNCRFDYTYDALGRRTQTVTAGGTRTYGNTPPANSLPPCSCRCPDRR